MQIEEIQRAVRKLPAAKRRQLTTWMVREFPALTVESLITRGARRARAGTFRPEPPTIENVPRGSTLDHVKQTAKRLGIAK